MSLNKTIKKALAELSDISDSPNPPIQSSATQSLMVVLSAAEMLFVQPSEFDSDLLGQLETEVANLSTERLVQAVERVLRQRNSHGVAQECE